MSGVRMLVCWLVYWFVCWFIIQSKMCIVEYSHRLFYHLFIYLFLIILSCLCMKIGVSVFTLPFNINYTRPSLFTISLPSGASCSKR